MLVLVLVLVLVLGLGLGLVLVLVLVLVRLLCSKRGLVRGLSPNQFHIVPAGLGTRCLWLSECARLR